MEATDSRRVLAASSCSGSCREQAVQPLGRVADRALCRPYSGRADPARRAVHIRAAAGLDFAAALRRSRQPDGGRWRHRTRHDLRAVRVSRRPLAGAGDAPARGSASVVRVDALHPVRLLDVHQSRDVARPLGLHAAICPYPLRVRGRGNVAAAAVDRARIEQVARRRRAVVSGGLLFRGDDDAASGGSPGHRRLGISSGR